jgi:preprotein translocase subunit SecF
VDVISVEVVPPQVGTGVLMLGSVTLIIALTVICIGVTISLTLRFGWRFAQLTALTNACTTVFVLALFLAAFAIFQWEFSLLALVAMACLGILTSGFGAIGALIARRWLQDIG